jgi:CheY-like chemotaxis protein
MKLQRLAIAAILASIVSTTALACGDSLYRAGKGVSFRTYSAPLPGNLLIFGNSEGARLLAAELAQSGHEVQLVSNTSDLAQQLESGQYDVVIAPYSDHQSIESANSSSKFLPIAVTGNEEELARKSYARVMVPEKHELKHYLKAIHRTLKDNA